MESEFLTGKRINEAKKRTTDDAVEEVLRQAQEQLNRNMGDHPYPAEQERIAREQELKKKAEEERQQREREAAKRAEEERQQREREAAKKAEEERLQREREAAKKAEEERLQREREAARKAEEERLQREREAAKKVEEERMQREREAARKAEEERLAKERRAERERILRQQEEKAERERLLAGSDQGVNRYQVQDTTFEDVMSGQEDRGGKKEPSTQSGSAIQEKTAGQAVSGSGSSKERNTDNSNGARAGVRQQNNGKNNSAKNERIEIPVHGGSGKKSTTAKAAGKGSKQTAAALEMMNDVYVDNNVGPVPIIRDHITALDIFEGFLEFLWRMFKLAVLISIITVIVGFFLSRELLIRGRNGNLRCIADMTPSQTVLDNKGLEEIDVKQWLTKAKPKKLTMESDDGYIFVAKQVHNSSAGDKWAVVLHGYNGSMEDIYGIAMRYYNEGYNILMPDLRASGESEGSFIGMGWLDRLDVINWIDVILDENPSAEIAIHGVDMGADAALMLSGEPIKDNIRVIVADGAYTTAWDVLIKEFHARHEEWPEFPLFNMVNPVAKVWGGYTLKEASAVDQVAKTAVPILLIQGGRDTYVTEDMTNQLNSAIASSHTLQIIPNGMHEDCRYADPNTYYKKTFEFVNLHMGK